MQGTKPGFQVNNVADEPNERDPPPQYYPITSKPPQQGTTFYHGLQQSMGPGAGGPLNYQPARSTTVMVSPSGGNGPQPKHSSYLGFSIFNLLFCCWPIGLCALRYSLKSRRCADRNDPEGAARHGSTALGWNICGLVVGITLQIALVVYYFYILRHDKHFEHLFQNQ